MQDMDSIMGEDELQEYQQWQQYVQSSTCIDTRSFQSGEQLFQSLFSQLNEPIMRHFSRLIDKIQARVEAEVFRQQFKSLYEGFDKKMRGDSVGSYLQKFRLYSKIQDTYQLYLSKMAKDDIFKKVFDIVRQECDQDCNIISPFMIEFFRSKVTSKEKEFFNFIGACIFHIEYGALHTEFRIGEFSFNWNKDSFVQIVKTAPELRRTLQVPLWTNRLSEPALLQITGIILKTADMIKHDTRTSLLNRLVFSYLVYFDAISVRQFCDMVISYNKTVYGQFTNNCQHFVNKALAIFGLEIPNDTLLQQHLANIRRYPSSIIPSDFGHEPDEVLRTINRTYSESDIYKRVVIRYFKAECSLRVFKLATQLGLKEEEKTKKIQKIMVYLKRLNAAEKALK